jgi:hypothetical protein
VKVSSTIEEQFSNDDEQIVSKSRLSFNASQLPYKGFLYGIEVQATSGHELTFSHENDIDSNIPGLETKMKQTAKGKQEFVVNVPRLVEIPSIANSDVIFKPFPFLRYSSYQTRSLYYSKALTIRYSVLKRVLRQKQGMSHLCS